MRPAALYLSPLLLWAAGGALARRGFFLSTCVEKAAAGFSTTPFSNSSSATYSEVDFYEEAEDACAQTDEAEDGTAPFCRAPDDWGWVGDRIKFAWEGSKADWCVAFDTNDTPLCVNIVADAQEYPDELAGTGSLSCGERVLCYRFVRQRLWESEADGVACRSEYFCVVARDGAAAGRSGALGGWSSDDL